MIISENRQPSLDEFRHLMATTDDLLNKEAVGREKYYSKRNGIDLEKDVCDALERCAINTPFEGTIQLVSGVSYQNRCKTLLDGGRRRVKKFMEFF